MPYYRRHLQDGSGSVEAAPPNRPNSKPTRALYLRHHYLVPITAAAAAVALLAVIAGFFLCRWRRRRKRASKTAPSSPHSSSRSPSVSNLKKAHQIQQGKGGVQLSLQQQEEQPTSSGPRRFSYDQLRRATTGFAPANKLGQGGFGPVFRGGLPLPVPPGGVLMEEVAVKLMDSGSLQGEIEFQNELSLAESMVRTSPDGKIKPEADGDEEVELIRRRLEVRKHVVLPIGFCSEDEPEDELEARRRQQRDKKKKKKKRRKKKKKRPGWFDPVKDDDSDSSDSDSVRVASELDLEEGGEVIRKRVLLLVYELMHNGSLQDALLIRKCPELMSWSRRYAVAMDVARALRFLHTSDPPVVHGDIKPSNVLLDSRFSAKIADFGLARPLSASAPSPDAASPSAGHHGIGNIFTQKGDAADQIGKDAGAVIIGIGAGGGVGDDNESTCTAAETESTFTGCGGGAITIDLGGRGSPEDDGCLSLPFPEGEEPGSPDISPMRLEVASACEVGVFDRLSVDSGVIDAAGSRKAGGYANKNVSSTQDGWWWQQDTGGATTTNSSSGVNEYVIKWIGSEVRKQPPKGSSNWATVGDASNGSGTAAGAPAMASASSKKKQPKTAREWWAFLDDERLKKGLKRGNSGSSSQNQNQRRVPREWWREEFCDELARKSKRKQQQQQVRATSPTIRSVLEDPQATPLDRRSKQHRRRRSWSRGSRASSDWRGPDTPSGPLAGRPSHEWGGRVAASGEIPRSCAVSSTPSMRGTVCYAAPECGLSGEPPSVKCDIYSFGVLLLVIVSGRRPLQVTASPMSEFERANLISWARGLACRGKNLLDLLDPGLQGPVDKDQALLCVTVALLCLQRSPSRRPSITDVVAMLSGETEPPQLPVEFSPSPQISNYAFRSSRARRKTAR